MCNDRSCDDLFTFNGIPYVISFRAHFTFFTMSLHNSKRTALLHLVNSLPPDIGAIQTFSELSDGKLFCDIIKIKTRVTQESKDVRLLDSVNSELEDGKMICEDSKTESEDVIKKDSETIQESDTELVKFAVSDSEHTITPTKSANRDDTSVFRNAESAIKQVKSSLSNSESLTKPPKSLDGDSKSVIDPARSSDSDDISNRFERVQNFIDEIYGLESELVICYHECKNANELELAKVTIFIMSSIIQCLVRDDNSIIETLSHLDNRIQQDLEQCFSFFINERKKITKENVHKLLSSEAEYKISSTPRNCNTPRTCNSAYKSKSPASTSQEKVPTPLKEFFDSPNFINMTIKAKTKEIQKLKKCLYEEEDRHNDDVEQLLTDVKTKAKEIKKLKEKIKRLNAEMRTEEKPKDCEDCKKKDEIIKKHTEILGKITHKNETKCEKCAKLEKTIGNLHTSFSLVKMQADHAMGKADRAEQDTKNVVAKVWNLEKENEELREQLMFLEQLSKERNKRLESPEHDDTAINSSYTEGNENLHKEILQVQCLEQHIDFSGKNESNVSVPELLRVVDLPEDESLRVVDLPEDEKFQNSDKSANKECSNVSDVSSSKTLNTTLSTDSTSVSSNQCNSSTSDYENAAKVLLLIPREILDKLRNNILSDITLHSTVSGHNGSNNGICLRISQMKYVNECMGYFKISYSIPQTAESQNNNSISKDMTNETESGSCEEYPNKKARIDDPNSNITTMNEECCDVYRIIQIDELKKKQKEIESFIQKIEKEQEKTDNLKKGLQEKQKEIDSLKKELDEKQEEIDSLKKELENKQEKIKNLKKEDINGLKRRLEKKQEEIDSLKQGIEEKQEEIKKLKKGKEDINSLKNRLEKKQEEIDSLKKELENEQEEIKNFKKEQEDINSLKKRLEKKGENIDSLKKGLQEKQEEINSLKKGLKEKQEEIDSLKKGLKEKQEEIDSLKKGLEEEKETVDSLKNKLEEVSENLKLKENDQEFLQEKYLCAKRYYQEKIKPIEQNQRRFEMEIKKLKQRKNYTINRKNSENSSLKMDLNTMCRSQAKTAAELSACINKLKKLEKENEQLHETIKNLEETKKDIDERKKEVEQKLGHTNALLKALSSKTSAENSLLPGIKGIKDEYTHLENTNDGFSKSKYISASSTEITALDTGNESTLSCALYSRSFKGGLPFVNDDEEVFLNHSSIAEIHKDYESADVQEDTRRQELKRRNTMCASHMQSTYAAEGIFLTPVDKKLSKYKKYKKSDVVKPEYHLDNNGHIRKKRKVSEVEAEDQSSKLLTTPAAKIRTFKTPSSLHKLLQFKRIQRPGSIKPKP